MPGKHGVRLLPWVDEHKYMGAMLSYDSYQSATFLHRLESCRKNYNRLRKFLYRRQCLTLEQRVQMWRTCVWSSLRYALHATGLTAERALKIRGVVASHLRAIACSPGSPRHLTGETNSSLYARLGVLDPVEQLYQESSQLVNRLRAKGGSVVSTLEWALEIIQQAERVQQSLKAQAENRTRLIPVDADCEGVPCPHCGMYFLSEGSLAKHVGIKPPDIVQQAAVTASTLELEDLGVDGMSVCARCGAKFHSWQSLKRHVKKGRCKVMQLQRETDRATTGQNEAIVPVSRRYQLLQTFQDDGFELVLLHDGLFDELKRHCCICRQWIGDVRHMKLHMRNSYGDLWSKHQALSLEQCGKYFTSVSNPCRFCAGSVSYTHRARHAKQGTILLQVAFASEIAIFEGHVCRGAGSGRLHASLARAAREEGERAERGNGGGNGQGQESKQIQCGQRKLEGCQKKGGDQETSSGDRRRNSNQVEMQQLLKGVAALCLRREDSLSLLHLDKGFVLFQKTKSPESLLQAMFSISTQWKKSKETGQVTSPLRVVLLKCFVTELQARLEKVDQDEPTKAAVIKAGWATQKDTEGMCWPYFQYDPQTKTETVDASKAPIPHARAIDVLKGILVLLSPETLRKFHATRLLAEQCESEKISFLIHVALRGDLSEQLYRQLLQLEHSSTLFLMGARLRRERIQRSPLANHVANLM